MIQPVLKIARLVCSAMLLLSLVGCAAFKKKNGEEYAGVDGDYVSGTPLPDRQDGVSFMGSNVDKSKFSPVYFSYDSYSLEGGEMSKVSEVAQFMKSSKATIIIAGFTDERGTPDYNRGLGERRAQALREALLSNGVSSDQVQTVSFGEEMPSGGGFEKDRRAEFGVTR